MNFTKRTLAWVLLLAAAAATASCGGGDTAAETTAAVTEKTAETVVDDNRVNDNLPEMDYGGDSVTILYREEVAYEFDTEQTGEPVDDAVYDRNRAISERFNLTLDYMGRPGLWTTQTEYQGLITNTVLAGDSTFDIITGQSNIVLPLATENIYLDLADAKYIDYSKPYWKDGYHDNATINGHLYSVSGDYALTTLTETNVILFHAGLFNDYDIEYPYQLVRDGKWTLDAFLELVESFSADLNGDSVIDENDLRGFTAYGNSINPLTYSTQTAIMAKQDDGTYIIDFPKERHIEVYDKVWELIRSPYFLDREKAPEGFAHSDNAVVYELEVGRSAMVGVVLKGVEWLRDMEEDFGILPYPKYDEAQKDYVCSILRRFTVASVPITAADPDQSSLVLEALSCIGYNEIIPTYFNVALKDKYTRDSDTAEMLDIIQQAAYFDFADAFYGNLSGVSDYLTSYAYYNNNAKGLASHFAKQEKTIQKDLDALYEAYED